MKDEKMKDEGLNNERTRININFFKIDVEGNKHDCYHLDRSLKERS